MRKLFVLVLVSAFAAACGGGSSNDHSPRPLAGTFGGHAFTPTEVKAIVSGSGTTACTGIPVIGAAGVKAVALQVTSYANACGDFASSTCAYHGNAQNVTIAVAKLAPATPQDTNPAEPTIGPGTYNISASLSGAIPDPTHAGWLVVAFAQALTTGAAPTCTGTPETATGGTLTLSQVSTTTIGGSVTLTFANGDALSGDFSAVPVCAQAPDVCGLAQVGGLCDPTNATCT